MRPEKIEPQEPNAERVDGFVPQACPGLRGVLLTPHDWFALPTAVKRLSEATSESEWHQIYWSLRRDYEQSWSMRADWSELYELPRDTLERTVVFERVQRMFFDWWEQHPPKVEWPEFRAWPDGVLPGYRMPNDAHTHFLYYVTKMSQTPRPLANLSDLKHWLSAFVENSDPASHIYGQLAKHFLYDGWRWKRFFTGVLEPIPDVPSDIGARLNSVISFAASLPDSEPGDESFIARPIGPLTRQWSGPLSKSNPNDSKGASDLQSEVNDDLREAARLEDFAKDNESKERVLVGEVMKIVALAGQISRDIPVSDHGIDMEIEFKDDAGDATGKRLYLQLKSGDSHLTIRKLDGVEVFQIKNPRHVAYWMNQAFPVLLVVRNSAGEVRWMEVRDWLRKATDNGKTQVTQIVFKGDRFDVESIRHWRKRLLG